MDGGGETGSPIHCGCVILVLLALVGGVAITFTLGWRWLWLLPVAAVLVCACLFIVTLLESRWFAVTRQDEARGVPACCASCGEQQSAVISGTHYKTRCPICGHVAKGRLTRGAE